MNNAGLLRSGPAWRQPAEDRRLLFEVNALGTINGTLAAREPMREAGRGHVVNVCSLAGLVASPGQSLYSATKHAAVAFSLGVLSDLRQEGYRDVHVSALCPDGIWTPMLHEMAEDPSCASSWTERGGQRDAAQ